MVWSVPGTRSWTLSPVDMGGVIDVARVVPSNYSINQATSVAYCLERLNSWCASHALLWWEGRLTKKYNLRILPRRCYQRQEHFLQWFSAPSATFSIILIAFYDTSRTHREPPDFTPIVMSRYCNLTYPAATASSLLPHRMKL